MSEQQLDAPKRIVVGVDGSEPSKAALRWAVPIAQGVFILDRLVIFLTRTRVS
jgi:nucleotide-binding universal stress UspA family protein